MRTLAIDIETYSSVSLQKCGVYAYAQSPDFEILLFGYAWDDGPVEVIDLARGESLPEELQNALYDPEILKTAFNASFERTCLSAFMGRVTPPEQWSCTAVMARELGLPGSLEAVGEVIGLPEDKQKSMGANAGAVGVYLSKRGFSFKRGFQPTKDDLERFREDYGISANAPTKKITLENFSFCFSGAFNAASFVKQIKAFVPEGQLLRVSVAVEVVEPEPSATEPATEESP